MPIIQGYEDRIQAQGGLNVRATPDDFGAQIGQSLQRFGAGVSDVGEAVFKHEEVQDATRAHVEVAKARPAFSQTLKEMANATQPGDDTLAPRMMQSISQWSDKAAENASTPAGKRLYKTLGANMASEFGQRAVEIQAELAAKEALNQNRELETSLGVAVFADPSQAQAAIAQGLATLDDPSTIYAKIPQSARNELKQKLEQKLAFGALSGEVRDRPFEFLGLVKPEQLAQFKPFEKLLKSSVVPGGRVDITPATMAKAPEITSAAAAEKVNPSVAMAQADLPGGEDPKALAQDMGVLLDKFGGNYKAALAAFHAGTEALSALGRQFGNAWLEHLPAATAEYVDQVLMKAGQIPTSTPAQPEVQESAPLQQVPVSTPVAPLLGKLSWEQQDHLFGEAVRLGHLKLGMAKEARAEAELAKKEDQEKIRLGYEQQIFQPATYGRFDSKAVWADQTLDTSHKEHLQNVYDRRIRELRSDGESKTNPDEVRRLDKMIHASVDDPTKTFSFEPVQKSYEAGRISFQERNALLGVFEQAKDGDSAGFGARVKKLQAMADLTLSRSIEGQTGALTGATGNAYYAWWNDLQSRIQAKRKAGEDPYVLLDPNSKEFAGDLQRIFSFMPNARQVLADGAEKAKASAFKIGDVHKGRPYLGGDPAQPSSWGPKVGDVPVKDKGENF